MMSRAIFIILMFVVGSLVLAGCGTTTILVPVTRPAEINLKNFNKIAVGEIEGRGGADLADDLTDALVSSGRFEVLDRRHLDEILCEHDLSLSGYIDEATAVKVGKLVGAAVLVGGRVSVYKYEEKIERVETVDKKGIRHVSNTRVGRANISANLQLTNLTTGRILTAKRFDRVAERRTYGYDRPPDEIDHDRLLAEARAIVVTDFMKKIAPYKEMVRVKLLKDSDIPALEEGINWAKRGEWERAAEVFKSATKEYPRSDKAFYNLGVALEYSYLFPEAVEALRQAYEINPDEQYQDEIANVRRMEAEQKRLQEQE